MNKNIIIKIERANDEVAPGPERPSYNCVPDINDVPSASDFNFTTFCILQQPSKPPVFVHLLTEKLPRSA